MLDAITRRLAIYHRRGEPRWWYYTQGKLRAKVPAKSSNLNFEGYSLEFVRMEIWYKLKYTHSWFGTRKNMRQRMYHFIILTHVTKLFDGYF